MSRTKEIYTLKILSPKIPSLGKTPIHDGLILGSSPESGLQISLPELDPTQGRFHFQNGVLTYTDLSSNGLIKIGRQQCKKGRMYILDKGDKIIGKSLKILVSKEKAPSISPPSQPPKGPQHSQVKKNKGKAEHIEHEDDIDLDINEDLDVDLDIDHPIEDNTKTYTHTELTKEHTEKFQTPQRGGLRPKQSQGAPQGGYKEFKAYKKNSGYSDYIDYDEEDDEDIDNLLSKRNSFLQRIIKKITSSFSSPLPTTSPSFSLKSIKGLSKGSKKTLSHRDMKSKKRYHEKVAGLLPRFAGTLFDILLFTLLFFQFLPEVQEFLPFELHKNAEELFLDFPTLISQIPDQIEGFEFSQRALIPLKEALLHLDLTFFKWGLFYLVYELFSYLLLGLSLGQFLIGLKAKGNFLIVRLLSPLRLLLSLLLAPFLLFDLPILINRKSFKEKVTGTSIVHRSRILTFINSLITMPLLIIFLSNYKLISLVLEEKPPLKSDIVEVFKPKTKESEVRVHITLAPFSIDTKTGLSPDYYILPTLERRGKEVGLAFNISSFKRNEFIKITQSRTLLSLETILPILKEDPLNIKPLKELQESNPSGPPSLLSLNERLHLMEKIYTLITFHKENPLPLIESMGINSNPYFKIYKLIFEKLNMISPQESSFFIGKKNRLITIEKEEGKYQSMAIIGLSSQSFNVSFLKFNKKDRRQVREMVKKLWASGQPIEFTKDVKIPYHNLEEDKQFFDLTLLKKSILSLQVLGKVIHNQKVTSYEVRNITKVYTKISHQALTKKDEKAQELILNEFKILDRLLKKTYNRYQNEISSRLRINLLTIQKALETKDKRFFNLNRF